MVGYLQMRFSALVRCQACKALAIVVAAATHSPSPTVAVNIGNMTFHQECYTVAATEENASSWGADPAYVAEW